MFALSPIFHWYAHLELMKSFPGLRETWLGVAKIIDSMFMNYTKVSPEFEFFPEFFARISNECVDFNKNHRILF